MAPDALLASQETAAWLIVDEGRVDPGSASPAAGEPFSPHATPPRRCRVMKAPVADSC